MIISIKSVFDTGWKGILACYICGTERGHPSPLFLPVQFCLLSALSTISRDRGECAMAGHGGSVSNVLGKTLASGEGSRVMTDATAAESSLHQLGMKVATAPSMTPESKGKSMPRRPRGDGSALIIDMEAARKAIGGSRVVGRLLSPFQVNPQVIVDELRACSAWRLHGTVTVQDVASEDGRFVLNFSTEEDRRFILKAQPWHHKRDGVIFAEFDGKGNPAEVDLGIMPIWVQVRDLDFELKTERMGWTLGEQIGDVIVVSHRDHLIVEKYLRIRVEIPLHEPLKTRVEFTPLGSSESVKYDVRYEKLPLYCECCGIVGHTSERYCSIPKDKRVVSFPKNLSVEAYWKGTGASKRTLLFTGSNSNNYSRAAEKSVVKVTKAVANLTVTDMITTTTTTLAAAAFGGPTQEGVTLGQEGRVYGAPTPLHPGAGSGQEDQQTLPRPSALSGQAGQGKEAGGRLFH
ncbi:hypothetical protein VPH35_117282 [Triticum aestivum]